MKCVDYLDCKICVYKDICKYSEGTPEMVKRIKKIIKEQYPKDQNPYVVHITCEHYLGKYLR